MIEFQKTGSLTICQEHGNSEVVEMFIRGETFSRVLCQRCLNEAIDQYLEPIVCADCGVAVKRGNGLEKDGVLTPYCKSCQTARVFGT